MITEHTVDNHMKLNIDISTEELYSIQQLLRITNKHIEAEKDDIDHETAEFLDHITKQCESVLEKGHSAFGSVAKSQSPLVGTHIASEIYPLPHWEEVEEEVAISQSNTSEKKNPFWE
jgi:hypothetical protein